MAWCLDASVAVAAIVASPQRPAARRFLLETLADDDPLVAPPLLLAETTAVLRRFVHTQAILHQDALAALSDLLDMPIRVVQRPAVYLNALELAQKLGQGRAYDVQYLAVAQMEDCPVVTLDRGLYESARTLGIATRLLT